MLLMRSESRSQSILLSTFKRPPGKSLVEDLGALSTRAAAAQGEGWGRREGLGVGGHGGARRLMHGAVD